MSCSCIRMFYNCRNDWFLELSLVYFCFFSADESIVRSRCWHGYSPVGLIVPLVSTTTLVSSRTTLEAQETKGESCFSLPTTWYAVLVASHAMFITAVPPYLSGHKTSAKRKRGVQKVRGNYNKRPNFPQIRFGRNSVPASSCLRRH
jgi:hypothetical protein